MADDVFDFGALKRNFADEMDFVGVLLGKFKKRYPEQLAIVRAALAKAEGEQAADAAHRLAGEASVFYAVAARLEALRVEDLARAGDVAGAANACDNLTAEIERLVQSLHEIL